MPHSFERSLKAEKERAKDPIWDRIYRDCWRAIGSKYVTDLSLQRLGIDRQVFLPSGEHRTVQEKFRYDDYGDMLLEVWSNKEQRIPGWIAQNHEVEFFTYNVLFEKAWIFSWPRLRAAWTRCRTRFWREGIRLPPVQNEGYTSLSVAVPFHWVTGQCGEHWHWVNK